MVWSFDHLLAVNSVFVKGQGCPRLMPLNISIRTKLFTYLCKSCLVWTTSSMLCWGWHWVHSQHVLETVPASPLTCSAPKKYWNPWFQIYSLLLRQLSLIPQGCLHFPFRKKGLQRHQSGLPSSRSLERFPHIQWNKNRQNQNDNHVFQLWQTLRNSSDIKCPGFWSPDLELNVAFDWNNFLKFSEPQFTSL